MSVWVMPSVIDVYENFLKRSQAVAGGRRRSQAVGTPYDTISRHFSTRFSGSYSVDLHLGSEEITEVHETFKQEVVNILL